MNEKVEASEEFFMSTWNRGNFSKYTKWSLLVWVPLWSYMLPYSFVAINIALCRILWDRGIVEIVFEW